MAFKSLVVDDDAQDREFGRVLLGRAGFEVEVAADPAEALRKIRDTDVSLVLTDYNMPGVNGIELAGLLKQAKPGLIVVLWSAGRIERLRFDAASAGIRGVFAKDDVALLNAELSAIARELAG